MRTLPFPLAGARRLTAALTVALASLGAPSLEAQGTGEPWRIVPLPQSSLVFARDGSLIGEIGKEWRTNVPIRTLPRYLPQAFVAVEDQRFYEHDGVDYVGVAGALKDAALGDARGASTITQQLVGNMHPDVIDRRDKSLGRKLREQQAAREMETRYSKERILEAYLNTIGFGHGWYGVESAARHYFGKPASRVTLAEAATLAAMPKGPAIYDPSRFPDRVRNRRDAILDLMVAQGFVTAAQAAAAKAEPVKTVADGGMAAPSGYFLDVVRIQAERAGIPVRSGGYRIHTTLDPRLQRAAVAAVAEGTAEVEKRRGYRYPTFAARTSGRSDYLQGMAIAMDPASGDVLALVGGRSYADAPFNRAVEGMRQPGSAFKPVVYAAALADSITASAVVADTSLELEIPGSGVYRPKNSDGQFLGPITLREALVRSRNPVAVQLFTALGADTIASLARRLGIDAPIAPYPSSALGASVVQPLDLVRAYAALDNHGLSVAPRFVGRVEDATGRVVWTPPRPAPTSAMDPRVAFIVRDMMRDVVERGTATAVRHHVPARVPVAGKTGTTDDNTDVWFVGMTPEVVAGVWLGFDRPKPIAPGVAGGTLAAPIWGRMIGEWYRGRPAGRWAPPDNLLAMQLDRVTGAAPDTLTTPERRYTEYFLPGTEPVRYFVAPWKIIRGDWGLGSGGWDAGAATPAPAPVVAFPGGASR